MKKIILLFSILSISTSAFAASQCKSLDLNVEKQRISIIKGITEAERDYVLSLIRNSKLDQILNCVQLKQSIAKNDSDFAIQLLIERRDNKIAEIEKGNRETEALLLDPKLEKSIRNIILKSLAEPPRKAADVRERTQDLINQILALTFEQ